MGVVPTLAQDTLSMQPQNASILWRGFQQSWGYNHRLNRMGDYADDPDYKGFPFDPDMVHCAATGLGMDTCHILTYYTYVEGKELAIKSGDVPFQMQGFKNQDMVDSQLVVLKAGKDIGPSTVLSVFINGFDTYSNTSAQKLQALGMSISDPVYVDSTHEVRFTVTGRMTLDCQSLECPLLTAKVDYHLHVFYLLVASNHAAKRTQPFTFRYSWNKKNELEPNPIDDTITGIGNNAYPAGLVGFKELNLQLDNEHWILAWNSYIDPIQYNPGSGKMYFTRDLMFKQWSEAMRKSSEKKYESKLSERRPGIAKFAGQIQLLQLRDACTKNSGLVGNIKWLGKNLTPDQPRAVTTRTLHFDQPQCGEQQPK
jgi:hypothetical protein